MSLPATEWPVAQPVEPLEQRIQQLESAIAALHDTNALEERIAERIAHQLQAAVSAEAERLVAAQPRTVAPVATPLPQAAAQPAPRPNGIAVGPRPTVAPKLAGLPWLVVDICREALAIFWMFLDRNYNVAWPTRLLILTLLMAVLTSQWWDPLAYLPFVGGVLDKLVDLLLAFAMFKALSNEARRYTEEAKSKK